MIFLTGLILFIVMVFHMMTICGSIGVIYRAVMGTEIDTHERYCLLITLISLTMFWLGMALKDLQWS